MSLPTRTRRPVARFGVYGETGLCQKRSPRTATAFKNEFYYSVLCDPGKLVKIIPRGRLGGKMLLVGDDSGQPQLV